MLMILVTTKALGNNDLRIVITHTTLLPALMD